MLKLTITLVTIAALVFLALLALAWWGQERIVFQPPGGIPAPGGHATRLELTSDDGTPLFAYLVRPADAAGHPAALLIHFHGNAEVAAWIVPWAHEVARRTGAAVLLAEYRGYAGIPGRPSYDASLRDARALWRAAQSELGATPATTIVHGFSLGSAIATALAADISPRTLILEAPLTSAEDMAARIGPMLRGPLWRLVARVHYDTRAAVASLDVPVWVAHGQRDVVIPPSMGRAVFAAARRKGELVIIPGAGHNDVREGADYWPWLVRAMKAD